MKKLKLFYYINEEGYHTNFAAYNEEDFMECLYEYLIDDLDYDFNTIEKVKEYLKNNIYIEYGEVTEDRYDELIYIRDDNEILKDIPKNEILDHYLTLSGIKYKTLISKAKYNKEILT